MSSFAFRRVVVYSALQMNAVLSAVVVCFLLVLAGCSVGSSNGSNETAPHPPVANAGGSYTGTVGVAVSFSGTGSSDPQGQTLTYAWNFGDGGAGTGVSPSHTYAAPGTYTISLTVTDTSNLTGTVTSQATIAAVPTSYTIGGTVSGLTGTGLVVQDNGGNNLTLSANGSFTFLISVASGSAYSVAVLTQPTGQSCTVTRGSGTASANVTNVQVACSNVSQTPYTVGGTVSGLIGTGMVVQNNGGNSQALSANGSFAFSNSIASGAAYSVTVLTQPTGQSCTVTNGIGTANANVTNVQIACLNRYSISGTVSGLTGTGLVLQGNGSGNLAVTVSGAFIMPNQVASGSAYSVTVFTQPTGQSCIVTNGSGTANANVTNVQIVCSNTTYTIGGTVSGLIGTGLILQDNGGNNLAVSAGGSFTFSTAVAGGGAYSVTVLTQPSFPLQACTVTNGSGTVSANISNVQVTCSTIAYTIGGTVSGLTGTGLVLQSNGILAVSANGSFTFSNSVASGVAYFVTVLTQPTGQSCTVTNGVGTASANVTNVMVSCSNSTAYTIGGTVSGLTGTGLVLQDNGGSNLPLSASSSFTFSTAVASGAAYNVTVLAQPTGQSCTVTNGSGTASANVTNVQVACGVGDWTWMGGSSTVTHPGAYGTMGTFAAGNTPGSREGAVSWTDSGGNLWLFGGYGLDASGVTGELNDLWEFNPTAKTWAWISGGSAASVSGGTVTPGVYGTQGAPTANTVPGPRDSAVSWTDNSGNLWLFGGSGYASTATAGGLNDLWEFNTTTKEWFWVSGSNSVNAKGVYGTLNVASTSNVPGARGSSGGGTSVSWIDSSGNLWLFGGNGYDSIGTTGNLNDLWEFSPTAKTWTWVSGSSTANANGVYGTLGNAATTNVPGARGYSVGWTDAGSNFWLYGGEGNGPSGAIGFDLSDLWEFSPTTKEWTWVSGGTTGGVVPVYGTLGVASASSTPGGRDSEVTWTDTSGNLWLFGGFDYDSTTGTNGTNQYLNDLWEFSPATKQWTWVGGSSTGGAKGVYGTLGTPSANNVPGARGSQGIPVTWKDSSGDFWLFGGEGYDVNGNVGYLNDLWEYKSNLSPTTYTIGGTVSGVTGTGLILQDNGGNNLSVSANGSFIFSNSVASGVAYSVTVSTQPTGQTCFVSNGSGTVSANVTNVQIACLTYSYTIGGTVSGLTGTGLVLEDVVGNKLSVTANGSFSFPTPTGKGDPYSVAVLTEPTGQGCSVTNGSGTASANVTNIQVVCFSITYTISGTVSGLTGTGLVLQDNGGNNLSVSASGSFTFGTTVVSGAAYSVTVLAQPTNESCTVTSGSGTATANVTNVQVACTNYTIGGTVSGLIGAPIFLQLNGGVQFEVLTNGAFTFNTPVAPGATYSVTIATQPTAGQSCTVINGGGTATANVTNVQVACSNIISVRVSGLTGTGLVLQDNGGNNLSVIGNGTFTFSTLVASYANYSVTVLTQPTGQSCAVTNGSGAAGADVRNIQVVCSNLYAIGGAVSGLTGTGLVVQDNGGNNLALSANGSFTFSNSVASGSAYYVTVSTQPTGQSCTVTNGSGAANANVTNVQVACANSYTIGGTVSGLGSVSGQISDSVILLDNGSNELVVTTNGAFAFPTSVSSGTAYNVTALTSGIGQICTVANGSGTATANVTNMQVDCFDVWTWMGGSSIGNQSGVYGNQGTATSANIPGGRYSAVSWTDASGNLWLFGGEGYDSSGRLGMLNDLWKFYPALGATGEWTWMGGGSTVGSNSGQSGIYGTLGTENLATIPGGRDSAVSWSDSSGNLWLFGGYGVDSTGTQGYLNDLWKFDPTNGAWAWMGGSSTVGKSNGGRSGVYGTLGTAASTNIPGGRYGAIIWSGTPYKFWLFGGYGVDSTGTAGVLNDLWEFDLTNGEWTWMGGSSTVGTSGSGQSGVYGTLGTAASTNIPGGRLGAMSWTDASGNLWLFGGGGSDSTGTSGALNDLWKFDPTLGTTGEWTWMGGSSIVGKGGGQFGVYGTLGAPASTNIPGGRQGAMIWSSASGSLWLLGGLGYDSTGTQGSLNDLWRFDPKLGTNGEWTWMGGSSLIGSNHGQSGIYGTIGTEALSNIPGSRTSAVSWIDASGNLWLFGGQGFDATGANLLLNDVWRYHP